MDETLIEKISFEYEKFKRSKICQAKENIFASSYEVETKKKNLSLSDWSRNPFRERKSFLQFPFFWTAFTWKWKRIC